MAAHLPAPRVPQTGPKRFGTHQYKAKRAQQAACPLHPNIQKPLKRLKEIAAQQKVASHLLLISR
jgi:hypothetical protein